MDLIEAHPASFIATDHVAAEIADAYPDQQTRYKLALNSGQVIQQRVDDPPEVEMFLRLAERSRLGAGERSAIAVALTRGCALAIDDSRAIKLTLEEAGSAGNPLLILRTQDVVMQVIRDGVLTIQAANAIRDDWANNHRFKLKIASFVDLI
jgi:predicted nucleic acid-binding protein